MGPGNSAVNSRSFLEGVTEIAPILAFCITKSESNLCIPRIGLPILLQPSRQTNPGNIQICECMNWERGRAVSFLGIHKLDFRYSAALVTLTSHVIRHLSHDVWLSTNASYGE